MGARTSRFFRHIRRAHDATATHTHTPARTRFRVFILTLAYSTVLADSTASVCKCPSQGKLASVYHHQEWLGCLEGWQAWDAANPGAEVAARGASNFISYSQGGAFLISRSVDAHPLVLRPRAP